MNFRPKVFILTLVFVCVTLSVSAQNRQSSPVSFEKISEKLYLIKGGSGANGGLYIGDNGVMVIDAKSNEESVNQVLEGIKKLTDRPVKFLVNTHSDGDHISGNIYFPETVTFVAHENCRKEFFHTGRTGRQSQWMDPERAPFVPSVTFHDKMDLYLGSKKVELWYFGVGHTTGDAVVYFPEEKTAFLGDQVFIGRAPLIHSYKGGNSLEQQKTLTKMLETLDVDKFCSGHADIIGREEIRTFLSEQKARQDKVRDLIAQGKSLDEIRAAFAEGEGRLIESMYNEIKG
ncbi:MBL fold metallo-hydrolase [candidate division KSB1 bacterium]